MSPATSARGILGAAIGSLIRAYRWLALRPLIAGVLVAILSITFAVAASTIQGFQQPQAHDEYSYLLGAETFAHGRLTNPTHPMWRYFETFHVLQQPTYNSKYPPANALFIAAGWVATGHPITGVWLSFAFMCVAMFWMLRAWIGANLGLGISLAFMAWMSQGYWSYSYWGGAVAAGAGALVLGALHRIVRGGGGARHAIVLGLGLLLLANSRPYEGFLVSLPVAVVLARWLWRDRGATWRRKWRQVVVPLGIVGLAGMFCMGEYNHAVTGRWLELPYSTYQRTRAAAPVFIWQQQNRLAPVADPTMRAFEAWEDSTYQWRKNPQSQVEFATAFVTDFVELVIPPTLLLPLLLIPLALRNRWTRFALGTLALTVVGMGLTAFFFSHYAAPLVGLVLVVHGSCLAWLARLRAGRLPVGSALAAAIVALWFVGGAGNTVHDFLTSSHTAWPDAWSEQRKLIADTLSRGGRRNVVIVRYGPAHSPHTEWVYNAADIDASPVVWARDMGDPGNQPLLDYFRDRAAWMVEVNSDSGSFRVSPYPSRTP